MGVPGTASIVVNGQFGRTAEFEMCCMFVVRMTTANCSNLVLLKTQRLSYL